MTIIDNCGGPPSYKALVVAYSNAIRGKVRPTDLYLGADLFEWMHKWLKETYYDGLPPIMKFESADIHAMPGLLKCAWFRNRDHPEFDSVLINVVI
jgi:hypothetical protein